MAATERFRIGWKTDHTQLVAIEPQLSDVATHAVALANAYNEPENARLMGHLAVFTAADVIAHYQSLLEEGGHPFLLYLDGQLVGDADLRAVRDGAAEFAFMIAAPQQQGRGLGTKFALMVHAFAFSRLALERIYASIVPENQASRRVFEKLGYALDHSSEARSFADAAGDVMLVIDRRTFERANAAALGQLNIGRL